MASIVARNVNVVFPLLGSDRRFGKPKAGENLPVGGRIRRGRDAGIVAIDDFSIELADGDRLGIFGHNGSGKSTLLRVLGGIYPPTSGSIEIHGTAAGLFSLSLGVNKEATGLENIRFKGLMRGMSRREIDELVPKIAEFSELGDYLHLPVKTYSSGMVMRLMFATASMLNPDILLLDEWISAGDDAFRKKADKYLDEVIQSAHIVIIASQNDRRLREWSNKLVYLERGRSMPIPEPSAVPFRPDSEALADYQRLVNWQLFEEALERVSEIWPPDIAPAQYYARRGTMLSKLQQYDAALAALEKALDVSPNDPVILNQIGVVHYSCERLDYAITYISRALEVSDQTIGNTSILARAKNTLEQRKSASTQSC